MAQPTTATDMHQLAAQYQLGTIIEEYHPKLVRAVVAALVFVALGIAAIVFIFVSEHLSLSTIDFTAVDVGGAFWAFVIIGLCFIAGGIASGIGALQNYGMHVLLCSQGLLRTRRGQVEVVRWEQIAAFWQAVTKRYTNGIYTGTTHLYTLQRIDGVTLKFNDTLGKVEALGNAIQREVTRVQLPKYIYAYNAGNTITFGPISINQQGVSNGKELLPWSQNKGIEVRRGIVSVKKEGKWLNWSSVGVPRIPNFYVFMALVDYAQKSQHQVR